ncbi:oligopeptide/dipeptide ABC transporter ATP-binding protein [Staphylococcus saccharolyticus]|uniref:Putative oligopeptide transport ATP-binding protein n=1 Tax=Staphylococcus saccharolyticus TaxID=33028 RepID=A0A380H6P5_9STAP|nr:putative oligopeptide transport ATP-binding protein [Staphylococcus saccharolyticus]
MSIILVTHDLSVVSEFCDKVMVMYAGQMVEYGKLDEILKKPKHPYTKKLLKSIPTLEDERDRLDTIEGIVPSITEFQLNKCRFANRCTEKIGICNTTCPNIRNIDQSLVRCHLYQSQSGEKHHE